MNITMVTTAKSPDHGRELLKQFGFPFREEVEIGREILPCRLAALRKVIVLQLLMSSVSELEN